MLSWNQKHKYQAFLGIAPTLVLYCCYRDGGPFDEDVAGLAMTLLFFLFLSPSKFAAVLSASCESFAELTSLSENILRSYSLTSRYSKSWS